VLLQMPNACLQRMLHRLWLLQPSVVPWVLPCTLLPVCDCRVQRHLLRKALPIEVCDTQRGINLSPSCLYLECALSAVECVSLWKSKLMLRLYRTCARCSSNFVRCFLCPAPLANLLCCNKVVPNKAGSWHSPAFDGTNFHYKKHDDYIQDEYTSVETQEPSKLDESVEAPAQEMFR
jgi:hypothetical protein